MTLTLQPPRPSRQAPRRARTPAFPCAAPLTPLAHSADLIAMADLQQGTPTPIPGENDALGTLVDQDLAAATTRPAEFTHTTADADDALRAEIAALLQSPDAAQTADAPEPTDTLLAPAQFAALQSDHPDTAADASNPPAIPSPDDILQQELAALLNTAPAQPTPAAAQESPAASIDPNDPEAAFADADAVLQQELAALLSTAEPTADPTPDFVTAAASPDAVLAAPAPAADPAASFEETFGVVEEVPADIAPTPTPVPEYAPAPVYDTFPARDAAAAEAPAPAPAPAPAKPRRKSRLATFAHDLLLTLAQLLDMPFRKIPAELKQYAGITGVVSATLGLSILLVLRFSHHQ